MVGLLSSHLFQGLFQLFVVFLLDAHANPYYLIIYQLQIIINPFYNQILKPKIQQIGVCTQFYSETIINTNSNTLFAYKMKQSLKSEFMKLKHNNQITIDTKISQKNVPVQDIANKMHADVKAKAIFKNITFCFPYIDVVLTTKRMQIISALISKQLGFVQPFSQKCKNTVVDYLLVNPKARIQIIRKKIEGKLNYISILDFNYIQACLNKGTLLDPQQYNMQRQEEDQKIENFDGSGSKKIKPNQDVARDQDESSKSHTQQIQEDQAQEKIQSKIKKQKRPLDKDQFFCQKGMDKNRPQMNKFIQQELLKLQKIYENQRDIGRRIAYGKAASSVRGLKQQIKSSADVQKIPGLGPKIKKKIIQIVQTGKLQKLQELNQSQEVVAVGQLSGVWGIGPAKAKQLFKGGIKSIKQLRQHQQHLNKNQKIGLKYYEDFKQRIPRQKVTKMYEYVKKTLFQLVKSNLLHDIQVCGSYRRGKATCGDMDIIITRKDGVYQKQLLINLVAALQAKGFLTQNLSQPKSTQTHQSTSYMGVCKFQSQIHHRIDIKYYPHNQFAFAILYFTGSEMFNRSIRLYATQLGLQLSDHGLVRRPIKNGVIWDKPIPICYKQQDIFNVLGLDYRAPKDRDD